MRRILENIYNSGKAGLLSVQRGDVRKEEEETFKGYCVDNLIEHMRVSFFSDSEIQKQAEQYAFNMLKKCCLNEDECDKFTEDELINKFTDEWGMIMDSYIASAKAIRDKMFPRI